MGEIHQDGKGWVLQAREVLLQLFPCERVGEGNAFAYPEKTHSV